MTTSPLLTSAETAARCRVSPSTLDNWVRTGLLKPMYTPGRHRRFHVGDVDQALDNATHAREDALAGDWYGRDPTGGV